MDAPVKKILIVEDESLVYDLYKRLLDHEGFEVDIAPGGKEGLEKIKKGGYDFILLDIILPEIDGLGILKEVKTQKLDSKNGPILVLSNIAEHSAIETALKLGAVDYVVKSDIDPGKLVEKIKTYTKK